MRRVKIGPSDMAEAKALAAADSPVQEVWADIAEEGLRLRVRGRSAAWMEAAITVLAYQPVPADRDEWIVRSV